MPRPRQTPPTPHPGLSLLAWQALQGPSLQSSLSGQRVMGTWAGVLSRGAAKSRGRMCWVQLTGLFICFSEFITNIEKPKIFISKLHSKNNQV